MRDLQISIGLSSFREVRETCSYYVDKTSFLTDFLQENPDKVTLFTRPRRFGKTLTMDMLKEFLDIRNASQNKKRDSLFEGLEIMNRPDICAKWMYQYPVIFLTLKEMGVDGFSKALYQYSDTIGEIVSENAFIRESPHVSERDKRLLAELESSEDENLLSKSLRILCHAMRDYYGKPVILLIDEYDVPLQYAKLNGYYQEMTGFLRTLLGSSLKENPCLRFAVLTGCLRIAKESIFTGLNNFSCYGISDADFADKIGFTSVEVDKLLADFDLSDKKFVFKEWYDGYRFGNCKEIYCPWDVLQYAKRLNKNENERPGMYWSNSSGNDIVRDFLKKSSMNVKAKFEALLNVSNGGFLETSLQETLTYDELYDSEENLWTLLYLTGYLTKAEPIEQSCAYGTEKMEREEGVDGANGEKKANGEDGKEMPLPSDKVRLRIPNKEVYKIYVDSIKSWFDGIIREENREELLAAFWRGDEKVFTDLLSELLFKTISFYDRREDFYHAFLTGLLSAFGYKVRSNRENGLGRSDITVERDASAVIIEVKIAESERKMVSKAEEALRQIDGKRYADTFKCYKNVLHWGIAFYQKSCVAKSMMEIRE